MEPYGGDGKIWEQLLQKAIPAQWGQPKGVKHQVRCSGGAGVEGPAGTSVLGVQVINPSCLGSPGQSPLTSQPQSPKPWSSTPCRRDLGQQPGGTCRDHKAQFSWAEQGDELGLKGQGVVVKQV